MARQSMCANHRDRPATDRCLHCNRPICDLCSQEIPGGRFCSPEHAEQYLQFQADRKPIKVRKHRGSLSKLILLTLLIGAAALGLHLLGYHVPYVTDALGPSPLISDSDGDVPDTPGRPRAPGEEQPGEEQTGEEQTGEEQTGDETAERPAAPEPDPTVPQPYQF